MLAEPCSSLPISDVDEDVQLAILYELRRLNQNVERMERDVRGIDWSRFRHLPLIGGLFR